MPLPHTSRVFLLICVPMVTGIGLFVLLYLHLNLVLTSWHPELHPIWGWLICVIGMLIILLPSIDWFCRLRIIFYYDDDVLVLAFWCVVGVLVFLVGWSLQSVLALGSYLLIGLLHLVSFTLFGFGTWRMVVMWREDLEDSSTTGDEQRNKQRHDTSDPPQEEIPASFNPWRVLGVPRDADQETIRNAFREQMRLYHPDKVAHLGGALRETAERKSKDINRAYDMLRRH